MEFGYDTILDRERIICTKNTVMYHVPGLCNLYTWTWLLDTVLDSGQFTYLLPLTPLTSCKILFGVQRANVIDHSSS